MRSENTKMEEILSLKKGEEISEERLQEFAKDIWAALTSEELLTMNSSKRNYGLFEDSVESGILKEDVNIVARTVRN